MARGGLPRIAGVSISLNNGTLVDIIVSTRGTRRGTLGLEKDDRFNHTRAHAFGTR